MMSSTCCRNEAFEDLGADSASAEIFLGRHGKHRPYLGQTGNMRKEGTSSQEETRRSCSCLCQLSPQDGAERPLSGDPKVRAHAGRWPHVL